jgi:fluoride exporter
MLLRCQTSVATIFREHVARSKGFECAANADTWLDMERFLWICLAGALGSGTRYLVSLLATERFGPGFPYGTLIVNVVGCFLLAIVMKLAVDTAPVAPTVRLALTVGFLGGLTTYSSFNYEATTLLQTGERSLALVYFGATTILSVVAGLVGFAVGQRFAGD